MDYCWFKSIEDLIEDHKEIKKLIKKRELEIDRLASNDDCNRYISEKLSYVSEEMMTINI